MNFLILGGAGFLGQHITDLVVKEYPDASVTILDLKENPFPHVHIDSLPNVRIHYDIDIRNTDSIEPFFVDINIVINTAGIVSFDMKDKDLLYAIHADAVRTIGELCLQHSVKRFVHISSVAGLGYSEMKGELVDEHFVFDYSKIPHLYYMLSKKNGDDELRTLFHEKRLPVVIVCPAMMWGAGDFANSIKMIRGIQDGKIKRNMPGGLSLIDVEDVARGVLFCIEKARLGEKYILSGHNLPFSEINNTIRNVLGIKSVTSLFPFWCHKPFCTLFSLLECISPVPLPLSTYNVDSGFRFRYYDSAKANAELGWQAQKDFQQTVSEQVIYLRSNNLL